MMILRGLRGKGFILRSRSGYEFLIYAQSFIIPKRKGSSYIGSVVILADIEPLFGVVSEWLWGTEQKW